MAAMASAFSDEECANQTRNLLECLKESNKFLGIFIKELDEFQIELNTFKEKLSDEKFAASVKGETPLEAVDSVVGFLSEELGILKDLETDLNEKLRHLEVLLESDDITVLSENNYFFELLAAITTIKRTLSQKVKGFNQNEQASSLRKFLLHSKNRKSE